MSAIELSIIKELEGFMKDLEKPIRNLPHFVAKYLESPSGQRALTRAPSKYGHNTIAIALQTAIHGA